MERREPAVAALRRNEVAVDESIVLYEKRETSLTRSERYHKKDEKAPAPKTKSIRLARKRFIKVDAHSWKFNCISFGSFPTYVDESASYCSPTFVRAREMR
jgi:hypothetical protein